MASKHRNINFFTCLTVGFCLVAASSSSCSFREPIEYRFSLAGEERCKAPEDSSVKGDICGILAGGQRMLMQLHPPETEILLVFYTEDALRSVHQIIFNNNDSDPPSGQSGMIPVYFRLQNTGKHPIYVDTFSFFIKNQMSSTEYAVITPEKYRTDYNGSVTGYLPFYWTFTQRKSFSFFHRTTKWYADEFSPQTGSQLEEEKRKTDLIRMIYRTHYRSSVVYPGEELRAFLLFPEIPPGSYRLEYRKKESPHLASLIKDDKVFRQMYERSKPFQPAAVDFQMQRNYLKKGEKPNKGTDLTSIRNILQVEWELIESERSELYRMHRQFFDHDKLSASKNNQVE